MEGEEGVHKAYGVAVEPFKVGGKERGRKAYGVAENSRREQQGV